MTVRRTLAATAAWVVLAGCPALGVSRESADGHDGRLGSPLPVHNLLPSTLLFGLPRAQGGLAPAAGTELSVHAGHANNFTAQTGERTAAVFDGSTSLIGVALRQSWRPRWEWGLEVPYVHHSGGFTDGFIEGFHDLFGFPDGGRDGAPRDRLDYRLSDAGRTLVQIDAAAGRLGDVRGWVGYRLRDGGDREAVLRAMVKAPTGKLRSLTGSGGTDASLSLDVVDARTLSRMNVTVTLMAGMTVIGESDLPDALRRDVVWSGHVGLHHPLTQRLTLRAQLDGHSEVVDSGIRQFGGAALQGSLGGTLALTATGWLDLAVAEDLVGGSSPDVALLMTLGTRL